MATLEDSDIADLVQAARQARENAYAPYSNFPVGAALLGEDGRVYPGCNVENASYGLCFCAERTAIVSAVAAGQRSYRALAVVADTPGPTSPCGSCRQFMVEFNPQMTVILCNLKGDQLVTTAGALIPGHFGPADMEGPPV